MNPYGAPPRFDSQQIIRLSNQKMSKKKIAKILGCSPSTVTRARRKHNWVYDEPDAKVKTTEILEMSARKLTNAEMARELGASAGRVRTVRRALGLTKPNRQMTDEDKILAKRMLDDGASYRETADTVGFSMWTIAYHFPDMGWNMEDVKFYNSKEFRDIRRKADEVYESFH